MRYNIGLDLGKRRDHAAIAILERVDHRSAYAAPTLGTLNVVHLERIPLGTPYTTVVAAVQRLVNTPILQGQCALAVDATGVGGPVVDMLRRGQLGCELSPSPSPLGNTNPPTAPITPSPSRTCSPESRFTSNWANSASPSN